MRFGTFVPQGWKGDQDGIPVEEQWGRIGDVARLIEDSGYDSIWVYDHFHTHPVVKQESTFEAWTLMAALAAVTTRARLGHLVMAAATLFGVFAVAWTIFEAFARRRPHEKLGQTHFWLTLAGILALLASLSPVSFRLADSESMQWVGIVILGATLFTLAAQLVFPVAVIVSWSKPKVA